RAAETIALIKQIASPSCFLIRRSILQKGCRESMNKTHHHLSVWFTIIEWGSTTRHEEVVECGYVDVRRAFDALSCIASCHRCLTAARYTRRYHLWLKTTSRSRRSTPRGKRTRITSKGRLRRSPPHSLSYAPHPTCAPSARMPCT